MSLQSNPTRVYFHFDPQILIQSKRTNFSNYMETFFIYKQRHIDNWCKLKDSLEQLQKEEEIYNRS